jgi:hypothetical protein
VTTLGATAALAVFCTSTYFAVGYIHYKRAASNERVAAQRAERANADLQDALDRLRNELAVTEARNDTLSDEGAQEIAVSEQYKADRIAQFTRALEQPRDLRLTSDTQRPTFLAMGNTQQLTNCTAGSAKDVGRNKNQVGCGLYPSHRDLAAARAAMTR